MGVKQSWCVSTPALAPGEFSCTGSGDRRVMRQSVALASASKAASALFLEASVALAAGVSVVSVATFELLFLGN